MLNFDFYYFKFLLRKVSKIKFEFIVILEGIVEKSSNPSLAYNSTYESVFPFSLVLVKINKKSPFFYIQ